MPEHMNADDVGPISRTYMSQGLELHYLDWGNEGAPLLIFIHGMRDHAHSWDWTARALRDRWHVLAVDLRGHGDSAWSPDGAYLLPYHILDSVELIDTLGEGKVSIVAHSFGGNVGSRFAALFPDRVDKLVIVDGLGPSKSVVANWDRLGPVQRMRTFVAQRRGPKARTPRFLETLDEAIERMALANPHLSDEQVRHLAIHGVRSSPEGFRWKYDPMVGVFAPEDFAVDGAPFWRAVQAPTLLFYGTESWTDDPETDGRAAHFQDRRSIVYEKAGHWLHHDQFESFVGALRDFL